MPLLLSFVGFCVHLVVIASVVSVVVSCVSQPQTVAASEAIEPDATLPIAASVCAKSMVSPIYTTTIDEPSVSADDYSAMTVVALKALCKSRSVKGYSALRKAELVALLSAVAQFGSYL